MHSLRDAGGAGLIGPISNKNNKSTDWLFVNFVHGNSRQESGQSVQQRAVTTFFRLLHRDSCILHIGLLRSRTPKVTTRFCRYICLPCTQQQNHPPGFRFLWQQITSRCNRYQHDNDNMPLHLFKDLILHVYIIKIAMTLTSLTNTLISHLNIKVSQKCDKYYKIQFSCTNNIYLQLNLAGIPIGLRPLSKFQAFAFTSKHRIKQNERKKSSVEPAVYKSADIDTAYRIEPLYVLGIFTRFAGHVRNWMEMDLEAKSREPSNHVGWFDVFWESTVHCTSIRGKF